MIPLARWLEERDGDKACNDDAPASFMTAEDVPNAASHPVVDTEGAASRICELEQRLAALYVELEEQAEASRQREAELARQLGSEAVARLSEDMSSGLAALQFAIEGAVCDVLSPFLEQRAVEKARLELLTLLRKAITSSSESVLELRAPFQLHDFLGGAIGDWGISVAVTESAIPELIFDSRTERFEELASSWRNIIVGTGHE